MNVTAICTKCGITKPKTAFYSPTRRKKDGTLQNHGVKNPCKACQIETTLRWREANPELHKARTAVHRDKYREKRRADSKAYNAKNRERNNTQQKKRYHEKPNGKNYFLLKLYGITHTEYMELYRKQGGKCAICGIPQLECEKALSVDHNHETGQIRGLLCNRCNLTIGNASDNPDILYNAALYLEIALSKSKPAEGKNNNSNSKKGKS